jgi:GNAT superfamily N-acetyltransferase
MILVRKADVEDASSIARVHLRSWRYSLRGLLPSSAINVHSFDERQEMWRRLLDSESDPPMVLVASGSQGLQGVCAIEMPSRDDDSGPQTAEVAALYVDPAVWGQGFGRILLETALSELDLLTWSEVTLWVFAENVRGRTFYAAAGFQPDGAGKVHFATGEPLVRLRMSLSRSE